MLKLLSRIYVEVYLLNINYFQWDNDLMTGIDDIDKQHQGLIEVINEVIQFSLNNESISEDTINEIYTKLTKYVSEHFKTEEDIMYNIGIDSRHIEEHVQMHLEFKEAIKQHFSDVSSLERPEKLGRIIEFLIRWLAYHILNTDKSLVRQVNYIKNNNESAANAYEKEQQSMETSNEPILKALKALFYIVSEKNKDLERLNNELEEKVRLRTEELQESYEKLINISMQDELTGLYNRRYALNEINKSIENWKRYEVIFSVLFIDIDKFKSVNDNYGHEYGDKIIKGIAEFLKNQIRKTDIACRIGGDEFLIICNYCRAQDAICLANKLNNEINTHIQDEIIKYWNPSISIGVAEIEYKSQTASELLNKADGAMYIAKNNGGNLAVMA